MYFAPPIEYDKVMQLCAIWKVAYSRHYQRLFCKTKWEPILRSRLQQEYLFRLLRGRVISVLKMKHLIGVH